MKTSSQLTKQYTCPNHNDTILSVRADGMIYAQVQKEVLKEILNGELPNDEETIRDEIDSLLQSKDVSFENRYQKNDSIYLWSKRIKKYCEWEQRDIIMPEPYDITDPESPLMLPSSDGTMQNTVVPVFGQDIKVLPDFITRNGNVTTVGKIKTSRVPLKLDKDFDTNEVYALGLLGKKLFPNDRIEVEINHLGDVSAAIEIALSDYGYNTDTETVKEVLRSSHVSNPGSYKPKTNDKEFTAEMEAKFEAEHEAEQQSDEIEVAEDCSSCPKFNICNYTEPPVPMDIDVAVKPISDIHLTEEQQQAVDAREGVYRINAGAGAGKTLVVAWRVKEMLKEGIDPKKILLITFTNAGAQEMKARVQNYCAADNVTADTNDLTMTTFNAFCQTIINANYDTLGFTRQPTIIPEEIRMNRINVILGQYPRISSWKYTRTASSNGYNYDKNNALNVSKKMFTVIKENGYTRLDNPWIATTSHDERVGIYDPSLNMYAKLTSEDLDNIFLMYNDFDRQIKSENKIEYADQIKLVEKLYEMNPDLFNNLGFEHIIVDEFQDTDYPQIRLLQKLKDTPSFHSLMCVGDDSQAIFGFRHTSPEYMINFGKYLGDGNEDTGYIFNDLYLVENHRSTADIIDYANKINENSLNRVDKTLVPTKGYNDPVLVSGFYSSNQEYKAVAEAIKRDIDAGKKPYDIAFLAFKKTELLALASELTKLGVPSILMNPVPYLDNSNCAATKTFFDSFAYKTTQGIMDYINAKEHGSLVAASSEEIQNKVNEFKETLDGEIPTRDNFIEYTKSLDPEEKDPCLQDFIEQKLEPCADMDELKDLFKAMTLYGKESTFKREGRYDGVALCTIHSAKGLEWDNVYYSVDSLDRPKFHSFANSSKIIEEKEEINRMHFVAASRAKEKCECVGKYTIKDTLDDMQLNNTLKLSYNILDKPYEFQSNMVRMVARQERDEAKRLREQGQATEVRHTVPVVREMSEAQIAEYNRLTENAEQMDITAYMNR